MNLERKTEEILSKFPKEYQNKVGHYGKYHKILHNNSKELLNILINNNVLINNEKYKIMEIGSGGCRNLKYIQDKYPKINFYANDLHKEFSFKNMHINMQKVINFYENTTQNIIKNFKKDDFNLIIDIDHLVHINYTDGKNILNTINNIIQPKYFVTRSIYKEDTTRNIPYFKHDFNKTLTNYKEIFYKLSDSNKIDAGNKWYIKLFKLNH